MPWQELTRRTTHETVSSRQPGGHMQNRYPENIDKWHIINHQPTSVPTTGSRRRGEFNALGAANEGAKKIACQLELHAARRGTAQHSTTQHSTTRPNREYCTLSCHLVSCFALSQYCFYPAVRHRGSTVLYGNDVFS